MPARAPPFSTPADVSAQEPAAMALPYPALYIYLLNDRFVPKHIDGQHQGTESAALWGVGGGRKEIIKGVMSSNGTRLISRRTHLSLPLFVRRRRFHRRLPDQPPPLAETGVIVELQTQLRDTQSKLAGQLDKIRALKAVLAEQESTEREVETLREMIESRQRELEELKGGFEDDEHDDDARSVSTVVPHELESVEEEDESEEVDVEKEMEDRDRREAEAEEAAREELERRNETDPGRPHTPEPRPTPLPSSNLRAPSPLSQSTTVVATEEIQEQIVQLTARVSAVVALTSTPETQHPAAQSTISALERKVEQLESLLPEEERGESKRRVRRRDTAAAAKKEESASLSEGESGDTDEEEGAERSVGEHEFGDECEFELWGFDWVRDPSLKSSSSSYPVFDFFPLPSSNTANSSRLIIGASALANATADTAEDLKEKAVVEHDAEVVKNRMRASRRCDPRDHPDVEPEHLLNLIETNLPTYGPTQIVEYLIAHLFENPGYPKVVKGKGKGKEKAKADSGSKRKADEDETRAPKKPRIDYATIERTVGEEVKEVYAEAPIGALQASFPLVPLAFLRRALLVHKGLYAPTHLYVVGEEAKGDAERDKRKKGGGDKGKGRAWEVRCEVFEEEKRWLEAFLAGEITNEETAKEEGKEDVEEEEEEELEDDGTFIESGCCFADYPFDRMAQCLEAHLFCRKCIRSYAANLLGSQNSVLTCMSTSGCKALFAPSELSRMLSPKLLSLYERLKQQKELKDAGLEGLEECPFCDWACVMEVSPEEDKLFRCGNEEGGCGILSCRLCKKKEHVPRTCKGVEEDRHLDGRIQIEEAMTKALMRSCPKCGKGFIKTDGCNKMTCPQCGTLSCYVCKKAIGGYDHFHQNDPRQAGGSSSNTKCPLWDSVDQRHDQEVKDAYAKALADYKRDHPDVEVGKDIKVDLPKAPPKQPNALPAGYVDPYNLGGGFGGGVAPFEEQVRQLEPRIVALQRTLEDNMRRLDQANKKEVSLRTRLHEATTVGAGHYTPAAIKTMRKQLSAASVERAALEHRADRAERDLMRNEEMLDGIQAQLVERRAALARWRAQQEQLLAQRRAEAQRLADERQRQAREEMQRMNQRMVALRDAGRRAADANQRALIEAAARRQRERVARQPAPAARRGRKRK
ncbi:hypothetical protein DFP72DRAFT_1083736 [Ephemerocybe angulata]|uniref:RING-type domain-containing protein n=1 Tax=Ephemerocybe angulata TaxID=980116 RepID=A0A8H6H948_9AGAR|nr:hypothetical protein DFP72DRAFT_1083736 [Tulosesus angulatus]